MKRYALAESQLDKAIKDPPVELMKNSKACLVEPLQLQGRSQRMQGLPGPAEHSFSQALAVARQIHSNDAICTVLSDMFWFYLQNWNFDKMDRVSRQLILATQNKPGNKRQLQALLIAHADAYTNAFIATHRQTYKEQAAALIKRAQGIKGGDEAIKQSEKTVEAKLKTTDNSASEQ